MFIKGDKLKKMFLFLSIEEFYFWLFMYFMYDIYQKKFNVYVFFKEISYLMLIIF